VIEKGGHLESDLLSDVLKNVRLSGAIFFDLLASKPWVTEAPPGEVLAPRLMPGAQHLIEYHVIAYGSCWAQLADGSAEPVQLGPRSIVIFPQGDAHVLSSEPNMRGAYNMNLYREPSLERPLPFHVRPGEGGVESARVVCGFLGCDARPFNPLLQSLPRMFVVEGAANDWLGNLIDATMQESHQRRIGGGGVLSKLSELLFIEAVRRYAEAQGEGARSWLAGLKDPQVGQAITLIHQDPAYPWTLDELARRVGVSRTVIAERFTEHVGMPPMTYLRNWRMQVAAGLLAGSSHTLLRIATRVGYDSEAAFSRAFKRATGVSPSAWREKPQPKAVTPASS